MLFVQVHMGNAVLSKFDIRSRNNIALCFPSVHKLYCTGVLNLSCFHDEGQTFFFTSHFSPPSANGYLIIALHHIVNSKKQIVFNYNLSYFIHWHIKLQYYSQDLFSQRITFIYVVHMWRTLHLAVWLSSGTSLPFHVHPWKTSRPGEHTSQPIREPSADVGWLKIG